MKNIVLKLKYVQGISPVKGVLGIFIFNPFSHKFRNTFPLLLMTNIIKSLKLIIFLHMHLFSILACVK